MMAKSEIKLNMVRSDAYCLASFIAALKHIWALLLEHIDRTSSIDRDSACVEKDNRITNNVVAIFFSSKYFFIILKNLYFIHNLMY